MSHRHCQRTSQPKLSECSIHDNEVAREYLLKALSKHNDLELLCKRNPFEEFADFELISFGKFAKDPKAYISYFTFDEEGTLAEKLEDNDVGGFVNYRDIDGHIVRFDQVSDFDGFSEFRGEGSLIFLHQIESLVKGQGFGTALLHRFINQAEIEMVFLHARDNRAKKYFLDHEFIDTGIRTGNEAVLVYRNELTF